MSDRLVIPPKRDILSIGFCGAPPQNRRAQDDAESQQKNDFSSATVFLSEVQHDSEPL